MQPNYPYYPPPAPPVPPVPPAPPVPERLPLTPPEPSFLTPTEEPIRLHGYPIAEREFLRIERKRGVILCWTGIPATLFGIFAVSAFSIAVAYVGMMEGMLVSFVALAALVLAIVGARQNAAAGSRGVHRRYQLYATAAKDGVTTEVYADRVVQLTRRSRTVVPLDGETRYFEYEHFLFLEWRGRRVILRAEDLTAEQAQAVYERICLAVPAAQQFMCGRFYATRTLPTPPPFEGTTATQYTHVAATARPVAHRLFVGGAACWLLAFSMVGGSMLATLFSVTPYFLVDYLLFLAAVCGGEFAVASLILWRRERAVRRTATVPVTLTFTSEGLQVAREGETLFVSASDVQAVRTADGATLYTPAGEFTFPWNAVEARQQLEGLLFGGQPM